MSPGNKILFSFALHDTWMDSGLAILSNLNRSIREDKKGLISTSCDSSLALSHTMDTWKCKCSLSVRLRNPK